MDFLFDAQRMLNVVPVDIIRLLVAVGFVFVMNGLFRIAKFFWKHFLRPTKNLKKYGSWAIVTGCTDGIGKEISEELAHKGLNIILVARNAQKLQEQKEHLEKTFKISATSIVIDLTDENHPGFDNLKHHIQNVDVGILVNNAGMSYEHAQFFNELTPEFIQKLIKINVIATTKMTYIVLPGMLERRRGAIVNMSSGSGMINEPMYAVYSGTKAFVNSFTKAIHYEYKERGIHIQCQIPALVTTKMSKIRKTSFFVCSARAFAKASVNKIGYEAFVIPYWTHAVQIGLGTALLPQWFLNRQLLANGKSIRRRALDIRATEKKAT